MLGVGFPRCQQDLLDHIPGFTSEPRAPSSDGSASVSIRMDSKPLAGTVAYFCYRVEPQLALSNAMLGWRPTTPQDYPE